MGYKPNNHETFEHDSTLDALITFKQQEAIWDYEQERMTDVSDYETLASLCKKALEFWKGK